MGRVSIQPEGFSLEIEWRRLREGLGYDVGAIAAFIGLVREVSGGGESLLQLEHYPGMTEASIERIIAKAEARWSLLGVRVVHRIGRLRPAEPVVLVLCASGHRAEAFAACEFIMDFLKTDAIFWKKELAGDTGRWIESTRGDRRRAEDWTASQ